MTNSAPGDPKTSARQWLVLATISLALFMILLDVTIVNIAIPHIMASLKVSLSSIEWVINIYVLVFAVLLLTLGKLGDLFGRRLLFLIGLLVFTLASLACSLAPDFSFLVAFRGVQAVGGAAMMPATLSLLNVEFGRRQKGLALGIWGAVAGAANALGPIIGGALVEAYSWHYIFVINIPIGIVAAVATLLIVKESKDPDTDRHIDLPGVALVSVGLFSLTFALVEGQKYGWQSGTIIGLLIIAFLAIMSFIIIETRSKSPLAQLRLFRNRTFSAGNTVGLVLMFGLIGVIFLLVLFLQIVLGFSAIKAGLTLLPLSAGIILVAPMAGKFTDRLGGRWILFCGSILAAAGIYLMSNLTASTGWTDLVLPLVVCGLGMGMIMAPVTTVVMASTPVEQSGMGAGILSTVRQIGSVMGIAVLGAVLQNRLVGNLQSALDQMPQIPAALRDRIVEGVLSGGMGAGVGGVEIPNNVPGIVTSQITSLFQTQFAASLNATMKVGIVVILIGAVASLLVSSHIRRK